MSQLRGAHLHFDCASGCAGDMTLGAFLHAGVPREAIESLLDRVETSIQAMGQSEVESRQVGEIVMEELARLDQVSYVRFASVYREFRDVNDFMQEIRKTLLSGKKEGE